MEPDALNSGEKTSKRYIDAEGFVRKERNNLGIVLWFGVSIVLVAMRYMPEDLALLSLISWPILAYILLLGIKMGSSHDINTWKGTPHVKLWIFLANMVAGLLGLIVYDLLKKHERSYLKKR